jgi:hypothetical protein
MLNATDELGNGGFPVRELIELVEYEHGSESGFSYSLDDERKVALE